MANKGVIENATFKQTWKGANGEVHYHNVKFVGDDKQYSIGCKDINPAFLKTGSELFYENKDEKGGIKKVANPEAPAFSGGGKGGFQKSTYKPDTAGITCGAALNQAVQLAAAGKVGATSEEIEKIARKLIEVAIKLKAEFKDKV